MKTEVSLMAFATLLCIMSAVVMFYEGELIALTAFLTIGIGCAVLMYKSIQEEL